MAQRQLRASDGHAFDIYAAMPDGQPKGGVVVIQEIFGVNAHIREVADSYAALGYVALAPALFDRAQRSVELDYDAKGMERGRSLAFNCLAREDVLRDLQATVEEAGKCGTVAVVGYCYGGMMAYLAACQLAGVACACAYYGGGIAAEVSKGSAETTPSCPVIMHFGARDAHIPLADVERIKHLLPDVPVYVYDAEHGFNCDHRSSYHAASAALARQRTVDFFQAHIG